MLKALYSLCRRFVFRSIPPLDPVAMRLLALFALLLTVLLLTGTHARDFRKSPPDASASDRAQAGMVLAIY